MLYVLLDTREDTIFMITVGRLETCYCYPSPHMRPTIVCSVEAKCLTSDHRGPIILEVQLGADKKPMT